ncbi:MAG: hypothetical protein LBR36_05140 [Bacteroidales bacterium]|jgi:hypothetical protein|nr:hypothetical protein [Bacteroidales bacterium]
MKVNFWLFLTLIMFFFWQCRNPKMDIPAYIYIDSVSVSTNFSEQGTASYRIPCVQLTVNGKDLGIYELPTLIPVLEEGDCEVIITACSYLNGISHLIPINPFYSLFTVRKTLISGQIDTITPAFTYAQNAVFALRESFEDAGMQFKEITGLPVLFKTQDSSLLFHYNNEPNTSSGIVRVSKNDSLPYFEIKTVTPLALNSDKAYMCYLEMNCKTTHTITIGAYLYATSSSYPTYQTEIAKINKSDNGQWRKVYINLTPSSEFTDQLAANMLKSYDIYISSILEKGEEGEFLFDNLKVVYIPR